MSTILKALRRLEQDKDAPAERPLREQIADSHSARRSRRRPRRRRRWGVVLGSLVLGTVAGAAILLGVTRFGGGLGDGLKEMVAGVFAQDETPSEAEAPAAASAKPAPAAEKLDAGKVAAQRRADARAERLAAAKARRAAAKQKATAAGGSNQSPRRKLAAPQPAPELSPEALASEVAVIERTERPKPPPQAAAPAPAPGEGFEAVVRGEAPPPKATPRPAPSPKPQPAVAKPEPPKPAPVKVAKAPPPAPKKAAPAPTPAATPAPKPAPAISKAEPKEAVQTASVSTSDVRARRVVRARVPEVFVARTVWHPKADRRIALVAVDGDPERLELHEGDAVGPLVVERIEPSGVYFKHDGVAILRRVGAK